MAGLDEDQLGPRLARGEQEAFVTLFDDYGPRLYRAARVLLASPHDAEDAVQAVFVSLLGNRKSLASVNNWAAYLMTCLRHEAIRFLAKRERWGERHSLEELEIVAPIENAVIDETSELEQAIQNLPEEQRQVIRLKTDAGLTFAEIAELLGVSANTAASRYRYAVDKLRHDLKEPGDG